MKKVLIIGSIVVLLLAVLIVSRLITKSSQQNVKKVENIIAVKTELAKVGKIEGTMSYTGNVAGINEALIISQTAGIIKKISINVGKRCGAGQVLAVIENSQQSAAVEQAKASVLTAEQNYAKSQLDLKRVESLFNEKAVSLDKFEMAQLGVKAALAQLKGAQAGLKVAEKQLADTYIKSTISGFVATKDVDLGGTVGPGVRIAHIVDISKFKIKIMVSETDAVKLQPGQNVSVRVDALPEKEFTGKLNSIGLSSESGLRSYPVEVYINNNGKSDIKSGMFARCEILAISKDNAIIVPENSIIMNNDGSSQVYVLENGKAVQKLVKLGTKSPGFREILSGISSDMKVITDGKERLSNGIEVKESR